MIIDGRAIAADILRETKERAARLSMPPSFLAIAVSPSAATQSYLRMKRRQAAEAGIQMELREYPEETTTSELIDILSTASEDALIVQLPLPSSIDTQRVLNAIPEDKDADVLSAKTRKMIVQKMATDNPDDAYIHPVAGAIKSILRKYEIKLQNARVVVVGQGWLVGAPAAEWLTSVGADVTIVTRDSGNLEEACKGADIIISGVGMSGLIGPELVTPESIVIDIGTSELGGSIAGDVQPAAGEVARLFTPTPGGVGPITVACLLSNVVTLAERHSAMAPGHAPAAA